jgi:hypothetical protein
MLLVAIQAYYSLALTSEKVISDELIQLVVTPTTFDCMRQEVVPHVRQVLRIAHPKCHRTNHLGRTCENTPLHWFNQYIGTDSTVQGKDSAV